MSKQAETSSYETFDTKSYLEGYFRVRADGVPDSREDWMVWVLEKVKETFAGGNLAGGKLLDVGTGPAIHNLISPAGCFSSITCAEFSQDNREEIEKWIRGDEDAFDWDPIIKYVCKLEGVGNQWRDRKQALRDAIEAVVFCDLREKNPLGPLIEPYDVVSSAMTLCAVAKDRDDFSVIVGNVASLVRPGGRLMFFCDLEESYYTDGSSTYPHCYLDAPYVTQVVESHGFVDVKCDVFKFKNTTFLRSDGKGLVYVAGTKPLE